MNPDVAVQSVQRTADVLEALREAGPLGMAELADRVDVSRSTAYKHLRTLQHEGLVTGEDGEWRLSARVLRYGTAVRNTRLLSLAEPFVREVAEETDEPTVFTVEEDGLGVFALAENAKYGFVSGLPGRTHHLHQTANGKAILARWDDEAVRAHVDEHGLPAATENTITDLDALLAELEGIRERGYAVNRQERSEFQTIGACVSDDEAGATGAISVGGPPEHLSDSVLEEFADTLLGAANRLEVKLRYV